jgi:hypothetical protein
MMQYVHALSNTSDSDNIGLKKKQKTKKSLASLLKTVCIRQENELFGLGMYFSGRAQSLPSECNILGFNP